MHSLNHVLKTRDVINKNDAKLAKHQGSATEDILSSERYLDHSFTRPKVNVEHMDRFSNEFGAGMVEEEEEKTSSLQNCNDSNSKSSKPSDFRALFDGNNNDHLMMGIKFTSVQRKVVCAHEADVVKIGEAEDDKEKDVDYLSSIEILIIDHADVMAMQNWSHVKSVIEKMNQMPTKQHGTDVMRIKQWYLDGLSKYYRQTIVLGSYLTPDMNALFNHQCFNYQGKVKLDCEYKGVLHKILLQVRQIYECFDAESILVVDDARFKYFTDKVFPKIRDTVQGGIMIFMSSYLEFVRIRNFLKSQDASFCLLGEYTKQSDISRARIWFFEGKRKIMLYTERAHFYHRYKSTPERKEFYPEVVNMLDGSQNMTATVLFSKYDKLRVCVTMMYHSTCNACLYQNSSSSPKHLLNYMLCLQLERIVGTGPAKRMYPYSGADLSDEIPTFANLALPFFAVAESVPPKVIKHQGFNLDCVGQIDFQRQSYFPNSGGKWFKLNEWERATNGFSAKNLIGHGTHGVVYKGMLADGILIAVKQMLDLDSTCDQDFANEVEIISKIRHRNLLPLRGCCVTSDNLNEKRRFLIYDCMYRGSLSENLCSYQMVEGG
uniref:non-specific serine/threonine protein kinase n=1 Tax=Kalanchoe fedtschenkoi TaxID=63787 RepID=A0A7N0UUN4_KALFE